MYLSKTLLVLVLLTIALTALVACTPQTTSKQINNHDCEITTMRDLYNEGVHGVKTALKDYCGVDNIDSNSVVVYYELAISTIGGQKKEKKKKLIDGLQEQQEQKQCSIDDLNLLRNVRFLVESVISNDLMKTKEVVQASFRIDFLLFEMLVDCFEVNNSIVSSKLIQILGNHVQDYGLIEAKVKEALKNGSSVEQVRDFLLKVESDQADDDDSESLASLSVNKSQQQPSMGNKLNGALLNCIRGICRGGRVEMDDKRDDEDDSIRTSQQTEAFDRKVRRLLLKGSDDEYQRIHSVCELLVSKTQAVDKDQQLAQAYTNLFILITKYSEEININFVSISSLLVEEFCQRLI